MSVVPFGCVCDEQLGWCSATLPCGGRRGPETTEHPRKWAPTTPGNDPRNATPGRGFSTPGRRFHGGRLRAPEPRRELHPRPDPELRVGVAEVELDGVHGDHQGPRDLLVGQALDREVGDPALGRGEQSVARRLPAPTRSSSARASSAQPGDPRASKAATVRSRVSRAAPHFLARRCARPRTSRVRAWSNASPSPPYVAATAASSSPAASVYPSSAIATRRPPAGRPRAPTRGPARRRPRQHVADRPRGSYVLALDERLDQVGPAGKAPGSSTPSRWVCSQTAPSSRAASAGSLASSAAMPRARVASSQSHRTPVYTASSTRPARPAPGLLDVAPAGGQQAAAALVHRPAQQGAVGRRGPVVEHPLDLVPPTGPQLQLAQVQPAERVGLGPLLRPVPERREHRPGLVHLAAPHVPLAGDALGVPGQDVRSVDRP